MFILMKIDPFDSARVLLDLKHLKLHFMLQQWTEFPGIMTGIRNMENWSEEQKRKGYELAIHKVAEREQLCQMDAEVTVFDCISTPLSVRRRW